MVLHKARPPDRTGDSKTMSNEQPVTKRQKVENNQNGEISPDSEITQNGKPDIITTPSSSVSTISLAIESSITNDTIDKDEVDRVSNHGKEIPDLVRNNGSEMADFEECLAKQCLCGVNERTLRKPFQSHYNHDANGIKRVANLSEWPTSKLLQFLSNLQLLFDLYLKQNNKGLICSRIMDVCDALIRNDHNLIDEIIDLGNFNNKYVQFLSGRVLASFLVVAKNNMDDDWLKKLVDNLFLFERLDHTAVRKIHFSLEIIKRIVEWKDIEIHPLEDDIGINGSDTNLSIRQLPIENNYFAFNFNGELSEEGSSNSNSNNNINRINAPSTSNCNSSHEIQSRIITKDNSNINVENGCQIVTLTDSESFDTTHLKCITIKILENKWPALVKNMSSLISSHIDIPEAESCILTFLSLWENIISVKANLSIVETLPFYAQLDKFELLLSHNLSCSIYNLMLSLFNEALCYGSTLALQDLLPEETCLLAHQIVRHIKDYRILDSLPRRNLENCVSFVGYMGINIKYEPDTFVSNQEETINNTRNTDIDKTILQKMVLLVLKSVAVTVKEIRNDSSDDSIDSTDSEAYQDMILIERSIRDVLQKLEIFIKNTLHFHPESHFSKILIHLFDDQDDHLIEAMVCTLDVTAGISFRNNAFPELVSMLNPVYTFLEFLKMISNSSDLLLDLLVSNETCFLLYILRFLKYIRINWSMFLRSCHDFGMGINILEDAMGVLIRLRLQISRLVSKSLFPYDISPILRLLESCESLYEGNELS